MENRNGLVVAAEATLATGTAEREAAERLSERLPEGATLGADKNYDAEAFVEGLKARGIEPHVAINGTVSKTGKVRKTAVPDDVAASLRYGVSQRLRKRIEEGFGWSKTVGGLAQVKVRGLAKVRGIFVFGVAAYNLVRLPKLLAPNGDVCQRREKEVEMIKNRGPFPQENPFHGKNSTPAHRPPDAQRLLQQPDRSECRKSSHASFTRPTSPAYSAGSRLAGRAHSS